MRIVKWGGIIVVIAAVGVAAWYLGAPLFFDRIVDEVLPVELPSPAEIKEMAETEMEEAIEKLQTVVAKLPTEEELAEMPGRARRMLEKKVMDFAAAMPDHEMDEPMGSGEPRMIGQGEFTDADRFHKGSGDAFLYELADGSLLLRFDPFRVTNGPDLHVLLAANPGPRKRGELGEYVDLGSIKGNVGAQNYPVPAGTDITAFKSVVIYCKPFHVVFATADIVFADKATDA